MAQQESFDKFKFMQSVYLQELIHFLYDLHAVDRQSLGKAV